MNNRIKLGPLAIFLAIITIILSMLALLNYVTANADAKLAERYGEVTEIKYELEKRGSEFFGELAKVLREGKDPLSIDGVKDNADGTYSFTAENGEYTLTADFSFDGNSFHCLRQRINKEWEEQNIFENILQ